MPSLSKNEVEVLVTSTGDTKGVDKVKNSVEELDTTGQKSKFGSFLKDNYAAAAVAGTALVATLGAVTVGALQQASGLEQTRIAFNTMLKDGGKAAALMTDISKFAASTPFEFPELAKTGKMLLAFGFSAQEVLPNLRRLGDLAAGLGVPIGQLGTILGQVRVSGRLMGQDLLQFFNAGVPIIDALAKVMGKPKDQIKALVEAGKVGYPEVEKALMSLTENGGQFAGMMDKQSKSLAGLLSTLKDNIGLTLAALVGVDQTGAVRQGSLYAAIASGVSKLNDVLAVFTPKLVAFGQWLAGNKTALAALAGILGGIVVVAAVAFVSAFGAAILTLGIFMAAGAAVGAGLYALAQPFGGVRAVATGLFTTLQTIGGLVWNFLKPSLDSLWKTIQTQLMPSLIQLWNTLSPVLIPTLKVLAFILGALVVGALWLVINVLNVVVSAISGVINWWNFLARNAIGAGQAVVGAVQGIMNWFNALPGAARNAMSQVGHSILGVLGFINPVIGAIYGLINLLGRAGGALSGLRNAGRSLHIPGFATGGYTGSGGTNDVAGIVHKGEYVIPKSQVNQTTGQPKAGAAGSSTTVSIGNVYLGDQTAVDRFFDKLQQNQELAKMGLATY